MITFIAFVITILGAINWLLIGLLQYDFIAGFFGFQASIFSRMFYILFGVSAVYLVIRVIANKGTFKIYEKRKKKGGQKENLTSNQTTPQNVEASHEQLSRSENAEQNYGRNFENYDNFYREEESDFEKRDKENLHHNSHDFLFDEHLKNDK